VATAPEGALKPARGRTANRGGPTGWLLLVYRVPSEPTRIRATVWRRVRGLGAIYLQSAAAALPESQANDRALRALRREILEMGGTAVLLRCQAVAGEAAVVAAFQEARNDEYAEIADRARDFLGEVEKERVAQHFSYAELEENEVDLAKLHSWLAKVRQRDAFGAPGLSEVEEILAECERSLEIYATQVYYREPDGH
jgi:hypothetical protein